MICRLWYEHYVHWEVLRVPKHFSFAVFLFYLYERVCSIAVRSWHPCRDILTIFLSSVTLAFGGKFLAQVSLRSLLISAFIQCRSIISSCSIIRCSSYLPLFAFVYWISIHSFSEMKFPAKSKGLAWHKMSRRGCYDLTTLSCKYSIKKHVLNRLILLSGHNVHIIINIW